MKKIFSLFAAVLFAGSMMAKVSEIKFTAAAAAGDIAEDATYTAEGTQFILTLHDSGNKMVIDANNCRFGTAEAYAMYNFRIKSGGASSSEKNFFTLSIPEAGTLRIAARSASGSATDRKLTIEQGADTLYDAVVQDADSIVVPEGETNVKVFPYVEVAVAAGEVRISYNAAMNFYGFALITEGLNDGYYLNGTFCGWNASADYMFEQNPDNQAEYMLVGVNLAAGDEIKVIGKAGDVWTWYPGGETPNYGITEAGKYDIYFRPDGQGGDDWFYHYFYVAASQGSAISNAAAEIKTIKRIENGQLVIIKNGVRYNATGAIVK